MNIAEELAAFTPEKDTLLTIGVFDGVHLGHRRLIAELVDQAARKRLLAGVVTFRQHPEDRLSGGRKLPFLTDITTRTRLLQEAGVDFIVPLSFTTALAGMDARRFVTFLQKDLKMRGLVVGPDFALGKGREGDIETLQKLSTAMGFTLTIVPPLEINDEVVSSTTIRKAMADGDMKKVYALTGRYFTLHGKVVTGAGRGEGLGFPTANLGISSGQALPPDGVYAGLAHVNGRVYQAMTNVGRSPTFGNTRRTIESYLIDYSGDLYGRELSVDFVARLRDEIKFKNAGELKKQLAEDVKKGRIILESAGID
ncbi:MAG: riboflavin biosynthesis protein RibF [Chloroflexi bacterium RBG_13_57_8]|nr:MAG: riboflavin biosynthesis protein RibF [Chloroflexi bacterium RBG_13_57_8]